jgi:hypothetical protein
MLAFELNVLRRLKFSSVILPFAGDGLLGAQLKRLTGARVSASDAWQTGFVRAVAQIQNNFESLSEDDLAIILEDAYVPRHTLENASLARRFAETDAHWFDNVRSNAEKLESHVKQAVALSVGLAVGEYVSSFSEETRELRQPLSAVYRRLASAFPAPFDNRQQNVCVNKPAREFIAENFAADLMFLRLPRARKAGEKHRSWREEWIQGDDKFWDAFEQSQAGRLGAPVETKAQYLRFLEDALETAAHVPLWAIAHVEDSGFLTAQDVAETVGRVRRVDTIFTKDVSELTGKKAVIITA